MKRILIMAVTLALSCVAGLRAQVAYKVTVSGVDSDTQMLYLSNAEQGGLAIDSARVEAGTARFEGSVAEPVVAVVSRQSGLKGVRDALFALVLDEVPLVAQGREITEGSPLNLRYARYQAEQRQLTDESARVYADYRQLATTYGQALTEQQVEPLARRMETLRKQDESLTARILDENTDNLIPMTILLYGADQVGYARVAEYMKQYKLASRPTLAPVKEALGREAVKLPGAKVVDLELPNLEGKMVKLTDYVGRGNYVLVDFWASWCGPCRQEMPTVKAAYEKYHAKGFEVVGISLDRTQEAWQKGVESLGITWPQMSDLKYWQSEATARYNIRAIPATILYGPDGTVVATDLRGEALTRKLAEIYEQK